MKESLEKRRHRLQYGSEENSHVSAPRHGVGPPVMLRDMFSSRVSSKLVTGLDSHLAISRVITLCARMIRCLRSDHLYFVYNTPSLYMDARLDFVAM